MINVLLLDHTTDPIKTVALAARLCYSKVNLQDLGKSLSRARQIDLIDKVVSVGHYSVLEHATFTFGVEGISRAASHQLVRHRLASYSQQSQRYCDFEGESQEWVIADSIVEAGLLDDFNELTASSEAFYTKARARGGPAEDARSAFLNAAPTKVIVSMNTRDLLHFFSLRCCDRAQREIREAAWMMLQILIRKFYPLFKYAGPACVSGTCPEGSMSCGKKKTRIPEGCMSTMNYMTR